MDKAINETIIRDILDVVADFKNSDSIDMELDRKSKRSFTSITSKAKGLTMVFPVIVSNNTSYDTAVLISKATEQKAAVLLSMLFQAYCISDVDNAEDFIAQFHTNLRTGPIGMDDFYQIMDKYAESHNIYDKMDSAILEKTKSIMEDLKSLNCYFEETILESSIDDFKYVNALDGSKVLINTAIHEDLNNGDYLNTNTTVRNARDRKGNVLPFRMDITHHGIPSGGGGGRSSGSTQDMKNLADIRSKNLDIAKGTLISSDVKKINELVPTMLYVNFITSVSDVEDSKAIGYAVVGVKAKLYVCDSNDIMNRLQIKYTDKNLLLNLVRLSTAEIRFFKDFIFAIDRAKIDALSQSRRGSSSRMWKVLERRALKSRIRRGFQMTNDATAITTLCITKEEVEYLKKVAGLDVENPRIMYPIMNAYNLMGFVIVDDALEIARFMYDDGEGMYETLTYSALEREQKDNTKKIVNLMSKMSR